MYLNIREHKEARDYKVIDAYTGEEIHDVIWADDATGHYGQIKKKRNGVIVLNKTRTDIEIVEKHGKIKFIRLEAAT